MAGTRIISPNQVTLTKKEKQEGNMKEISRDWPIGFAMELSMNETAMEFFSNLPKDQKEQLVEQSRQVKSKSEMHELVDSIPNRCEQIK